MTAEKRDVNCLLILDKKTSVIMEETKISNNDKEPNKIISILKCFDCVFFYISFALLCCNDIIFLWNYKKTLSNDTIGEDVEVVNGTGPIHTKGDFIVPAILFAAAVLIAGLFIACFVHILLLSTGMHFYSTFNNII